MSNSTITTNQSKPSNTDAVAAATASWGNGDNVQYVFITHYHKSGKMITSDFFQAVQREHQRHECIMIPREKIQVNKIQIKREHNPVTGCPEVASQERLWRNKHLIEATAAAASAAATDRVVLVQLHPTDFFCDLTTNAGVLISPFAPNTAKVIHMMRDPLDMAISNYLYHSQDPTPEKWILREDIDPCKFNVDLIKFAVMGGEGSAAASAAPLKDIMTEKDTENLHFLCMQLMNHQKDEDDAHTTFYDALRGLEPYDGLRLATIQLLLADNVESGGDLLRMANNAVRLSEWQRQQQTERQKDEWPGSDSSSSHKKLLLTFHMSDWLQNYTESAVRASEFLIEDLFVPVGKSGGGMDTIVDASEKHSFSQGVASLMVGWLEERKAKATKYITQHITQNVWDHDVREKMMVKLANDDLLGPILQKIRIIVNEK